MSTGKQEGSRVVIKVLALLALLCGMWAATQFVAWKVNYAPGLGWNIQGVYPPWSVLLWAMEGYGQAPRLFAGAGSIGAVVAAVMLIVAVLWQTVVSNTSRAMETIHGSARWANQKDINSAELLKTEGLFVGGWIDPKGGFHYLRHKGNLHVLALAPTRSGKGVCLVVPTLTTWMQSAVISDLKGELWQMTAGWRANCAKQTVLRFEPAALEGSVRWNPLQEIRLGPEYEIADVQNLAGMLTDPDGKGQDGPGRHWIVSSQSLLVGLILHILYKEKNGEGEASLAAIDALLSENQLDETFWNGMKRYGHRAEEGRKDKTPHPIVARVAQDMLNTPEKERGSIISTARGFLSLWRDETVAKNTATSDFKIKDLMDAGDHRPVSLYIITNPTDKDRLRPLTRVLINMICRLSAQTMEHEHKLLMMLDEFPSLGKLEIIQESLAFLAGYGFVFYLICQDMDQLIGIYGEHQTITANTHIQIVFAPMVQRSIQYISKMTGQTTAIKEQVTTSGKRMGPFNTQVSTTFQEVSRPLMTEDEVMRMPKAKVVDDKMLEGGTMLVFVAGTPAIYGKQMPYFLDPVLLARTQVPAPEKAKPSKEEQADLDSQQNTCGGVLDVEPQNISAPEA